MSDSWIRRATPHGVQLALLVSGLSVACAGLGSAPGRRGCPVVPVPAAGVPGSFPQHFRIRFSAGGRSLHLDALVDRTDRELVVAGFAPYGPRLFAVRQGAGGTEVESALRRELAPMALWLVDALHRVYWIERPAPAAGDGPVRWDRENERVSDWQRDGVPVRREFAARGSGFADAAVAIDYPAQGSAAAGHAVGIRSAWCGYEAIIVALEGTPTDAPRDP